MANRIVEIKRERFTFCTYRELLKEFREQSVKMNKSVSRRFEEFMKQELEKEKESEKN